MYAFFLIYFCINGYLAGRIDEYLGKEGDWWETPVNILVGLPRLAGILLWLVVKGGPKDYSDY